MCGFQLNAGLKLLKTLCSYSVRDSNQYILRSQLFYLLWAVFLCEIDVGRDEVLIVSMSVN